MKTIESIKSRDTVPLTFRWVWEHETDPKILRLQARLYWDSRSLSILWRAASQTTESLVTETDRNKAAGHRWASTSISMSAISDIPHRHLLFRYRKQICRTEKRHSDIGSVPISTSGFIPISDIEEKKCSPYRFEPMTLEMVTQRYNSKLLWRSINIGMSDIG